MVDIEAQSGVFQQKEAQPFYSNLDHFKMLVSKTLHKLRSVGFSYL